MSINTQLAQAHELKAKLAEEYRVVRLLRASIAREASVHGEHVHELGKQARECIDRLQCQRSKHATVYKLEAHRSGDAALGHARARGAKPAP
jgi:hypothetical protein